LQGFAAAQGLHGLQALAAQGLHGLQALAAQGLHGLQASLAAICVGVSLAAFAAAVGMMRAVVAKVATLSATTVSFNIQHSLTIESRRSRRDLVDDANAIAVSHRRFAR